MSSGLFSPEIRDVLEDYRVATISLPRLHRFDRSLPCAIRLTPSSLLEVRFEPGEPPLAELDRAGRCQVIFEAGQSYFSIRGRIRRVCEGGRLLLKAESASKHGDPRNHFRVDADAWLRFWPVSSARPGLSSLVPVNLSGGGLRFATDSPPQLGQKIAIELVFPGKKALFVECVGQVVGLSENPEGGWDVGLEIVQIASQHLDRLMQFCLGAKFRQMRSKAEFLGQVLKIRPTSSLFPEKTH